MAGIGREALQTACSLIGEADHEACQGVGLATPCGQAFHFVPGCGWRRTQNEELQPPLFMGLGERVPEGRGGKGPFKAVAQLFGGPLGSFALATGMRETHLPH